MEIKLDKSVRRVHFQHFSFILFFCKLVNLHLNFSYFDIKLYLCWDGRWSNMTLLTICCWVQVFTKIKILVMKPDALRAGISASDAAMTLGVAPAMAKEHLLSAESKGTLLCYFFQYLQQHTCILIFPIFPRNTMQRRKP